ncbi:type I polyketide synthase [Rubrivivax gelatinosus]|uniref:Beta-ketoacyl synthase n=1 Tax=Rubrivivax gelatinosus (strain NBRC 100245 / IL144) TaxID=983917 RepID=I0HTW5_RUBGI|nr:type I polyketide synthase [Rubrivivax gelatinosus]BAL96452.1 beta-ketoacyl synthase [Rubrivivax gelatinosus IL144]
MSLFQTFVLTPAGHADVSLAIAACRAGAVGVVNHELEADPARWAPALAAVAAATDGGHALKLPALADGDAEHLVAARAAGLAWLLIDAAAVPAARETLAALRAAGLRVMAELTTPDWPAEALDAEVDALLLKGNEAGGFVGEDASFILLQKWRVRTALPLHVRGGLTPAVAAGCAALGVAGGALDAQVLLLDEARLGDAGQAVIAGLSGNETVAVGDGEHGEYFRILSRPGHAVAKALITEGDGCGFAALRDKVAGRVNWDDPRAGLLPVGHDVCFAADWRRRYGHLAAVLKAFDSAVATQLGQVAAQPPVAEGAPLAQALGLRFPIVQGPMTRVSDVADFAQAVADGGGLPMVAFALLKGAPLDKLLARTQQLLGDKPWGIGLLGFAPQALLDEQLALATQYKPAYALIAGGRPDQAVKLEASGVPTFLHVPSANLIPLFVQEGARRFIFEGRECGGHIGPLSSFVLWSTMVDRIADEIDARRVAPAELQLLFAGGIHDAASSAFVQVLAAPLVARGVKVGVLMGSAYLFTEEIVASGAVVAKFQQEVIACRHTVSLESGPGHASRCGYTPFAQEFFKKRAELREQKVAGEESRRVLDDLIMGRLRIASKGTTRIGEEGRLTTLDEQQQHAEGMYMLGQVATLRDGVTTVASLHKEVTAGAAALLAAAADARQAAPVAATGPVDIAIVGLATLLPKADSLAAYWDNILAKVDAITEIPPHRWDWRLYYDSDRHAPDKIYSKWGGFIDDLVFDPTRYGMPPKSIEAVDPMQLMALEVARRTLADAGYDRKPFDRERASVIVGASGGTGDVGSQYGLRSELPRFSGQLPAEVAERLPEWTEDSFAGILLNVIAGRIANRLNFGGVNFTTDAACASSLAAVYQGVTELAAGRSDIVIAGGVDTVQGPFGYLCFSKTQALSPRGRCNTFDASGDGIVISEGIAMVALKRLADAERDGDRIYAVIKGVGGSSDGNAKGLTAPLPAGQLRAMRRAYQMAGFGPSTVGLFEAHGTGTVAGDTAELESTTRLMLEEGARAHGAVVGSVKTMIGHTKATAGVAGLVKAALALHHKVLPPHLGVTNPNPTLKRPDAPLHVIADALPWLPAEQPRRAACSAFGFGGTNFHVVMEEYQREYRPWLRSATAQRWPAELLLFAADSREALVARLTALHAELAATPVELRDLAASLARTWQAGAAERLALVARSPEELATKLAAAAAFLRGEAKAAPPGVFHRAGAPIGGKLAVLFPGQGSQYTGMGREAALYLPPVADALAEAETALRSPFTERFGKTLGEFLFPRAAYDDAAKEGARRALTSTDVAQPALGALEVGLWRLLQSLGFQADMAAGHSYGEFVAQHAAGAIDFGALMALSAARGRFIVDAAKDAGAELGTMAAVPAERAVVEQLIADLPDVIVANHNAPLQSIVSGTRAGVEAAVAKCAAAGIEAQAIPVAAAFHSVLVKPAQGPLAALIDATPWQPTAIPVYANATARPHPAEPARSRQLMAEHLVKPVEFVAQVRQMHDDGARLFVEVGPKAVLSRLVGRILQDQPHVAVALDDGSGLAGVLAGIGQLLVAGVALDVEPLFAGRDCRVGDPARLASLDRRETPARTAWVINGAGVRRLADPVKPVGVTLEQAQAALAAPPAVPAAAPAAPVASAPAPAPVAPTLPAAAPARTATPITSQFSRRVRTMDERRPLPATADAAVLAEYFETMRQFLESQERVMAAFLGQQPAAPARALRARPVPTMVLPRVADAVPAAPVAPVVPPAPVVAAAPVPPVAPAAPVVAPAPVQPAPVAAAPVAAAAPAAALSRDKLAEMLLAIVEEKTGYPKDMVGLDQNLESDLGIDSIKRIEVVGAMLQALPEAWRAALVDSRSKLNTQPTLNGMLDLIGSAKEGAAVPFDRAEAGTPVAGAVVADHAPSRHLIEPTPEALPATAARRLAAGRYLIVPDRGTLADGLATRLAERGATVERLDPALLADEAALVAWCATHRVAPVAGLVFLSPVDAPLPGADAGPDEWRAALAAGDQALFVLLRELSAAFVPEAHVLAASALGGLYGRGRAPEALPLAGGAPGLLKSLREERPSLRVKAVDLDPTQPALAHAQALFDELELDGGRQEVGYPGGQRTVFRSVVAELPADAPRVALHSVVVLATGGARGITAELLRELARPGNTLVLTGRSTLPEAEPAELAALADAAALRAHFIAEVRRGALAMKPGEINRHVQALLGLREMRANIADFRASGAAVEYHAVDVTDEGSMRALLDGVYARHGRLDGVVHGAGVIEDKLIAEKSTASWRRVVDTKVVGLLLLQKWLRPESLKFLTVFSSVAGRYGNSGQGDYATANELMNRICEHLRGRWDGRVAVSALCWGPWGPTKFGAGMVTAETEAKFAAKGVTLVSAAVGRKLFADEISRPAGGPVEVVCGAGPWERHEAEIGAWRKRAPEGPELGALLGAARVLDAGRGEQVVALRLDVARHLYLQEHVIDATPVLPAAAALEITAEAAATLWPGWKVVEMREFRLMKGVELKEPARALRVLVSPPPYGSSEGFEVVAALQSELAAGRFITHYKGVVRLEQQLPAGERVVPRPHREKSLTVERAYGEWLFHGPRFQVIEGFDGLSQQGAGTAVRSTHPSAWLRGVPADAAGWVFDPALLDAAAQMAWLWARAFRDESALPAKFGRVVRYAERFPERLRMEYERIPSDDPTLIRANVVFSDERGEPVMLIEELESIASAALNRLGGTARTAIDA